MKPENPLVVPAASIPRSPLTSAAKDDKRLRLSLEAGNCGGAVVLHCQGRIISVGEARSLSTMIADVLPSARRMVVDLAGVDSVDSGGLGEFVLTHMWAEAAGYTLKFACPKKPVRRLFEITNLVSVFDIYASVPQAMSALVQEEMHSA